MTLRRLGRVFGYAALLSDEEQVTFTLFHHQVSSAATVFQRNRRIALAGDQIRAVWMYCVRGDDNDWRRFLACGICWISPFRIAVHVKQFALLIGKSKSSVNIVLTKLGYVTTPTQHSDADRLCDLIPYLRRQPLELRHWVIREMVEPPRDVAGPETHENERADTDLEGDGDETIWELTADFASCDDPSIDWYNE
jgi:hypothetical protein